MHKVTNWYDYKEGHQVIVRFPGMAKHEILVPQRPSGIWKDGDKLFCLYLNKKVGTVKVVRHSVSTKHPQNEVTLNDFRIEDTWQLKKSVFKFSDRAIFDMVLNKVDEEGELVVQV